MEKFRKLVRVWDRAALEAVLHLMGGISRLNNGRLRIFCLFVKQLFRFCAAATVVVSTTATTAVAAATAEY